MRIMTFRRQPWYDQLQVTDNICIVCQNGSTKFMRVIAPRGKGAGWECVLPSSDKNCRCILTDKQKSDFEYKVCYRILF